MLHNYKSLLHLWQGFFLVWNNFNKTKFNPMQKKNRQSFEAKIDKLPDKIVYLNVNHLEKGDYELNIIHQKKIIKKTSFNKK